jgi:undecaprenyl-diphosphatase
MRPIVERLGALDQAWLARVAARRPSAWVDRMFRVVTHAGGVRCTTLGPLCILPFGRTRAFALSLLIANVASHLVVQLLKRTVVRRRPHLAPDAALALAAIPDAFSFPSGHACAAMAVALPCVLRGGAMGLPVLAVALLVGTSRVYLRVHYPSDVLAGQVIGAAGALLGTWAVY